MRTNDDADIRRVIRFMLQSIVDESLECVRSFKMKEAIVAYGATTAEPLHHVLRSDTQSRSGTT